MSASAEAEAVAADSMVILEDCRSSLSTGDPSFGMSAKKDTKKGEGEKKRKREKERKERAKERLREQKDSRIMRGGKKRERER